MSSSPKMGHLPIPVFGQWTSGISPGKSPNFPHFSLVNPAEAEADPKDPVVDADGVRANVRALKINCVDFEAWKLFGGWLD